MERHFAYARLLATGAPAPNATVTVYDVGTADLATIYDDNLDPPTDRANPFTTDGDGFFYFYGEDGRYDVRLSAGGIPTPYTWGDVSLYDARTLIVNVKDPEFGAVGDGVADDTTAIQAAMDSISGSEFDAGGVVYFPAGIYLISSSLIRGSTVAAPGHNLRMVGAGPNASLIRTTAGFGANPAIRFGTNDDNTCQFCAVNELGIDLRANTAIGIQGLATRYLAVDRAYVIGPSAGASTAVGIQLDQGGATYNGHNNITRCSLQRLKIGIETVDVVTTTRIAFNDLIGGTVTTGRAIVLARTSSTVLIEGNEIEGWTDAGIRSEAGYVTIFGNNFESNTNEDIRIHDSSPTTNFRTMLFGNRYGSAPANGNIVTPNSPNASGNGIRIHDNTTDFDGPNMDGLVRNWLFSDYVRVGSGVPTTGVPVGSMIIQNLKAIWGEDNAGTGSVEMIKVNASDSVVIAPNTADSLDSIQIDSGSAVVDGATGILILSNHGGSKVVRRVQVGAVDSGGGGFRMLRLAN